MLVYFWQTCSALSRSPIMRVAALAAAAASALVFSACGSSTPEVIEPSANANSAEKPQDESPSSAAEPTAESVTEDEEPTEDAPEDDSGELGLGATATVGDYTVSVTEVELDATDTVKKANEFNDDPEGQYVLASLAVTYNGDDQGDPWLDLSVELAGSDSRIYDSSSCMAVTPNSAMDVPTLTSGGKGEFDICFDVPAAALEDPRIFVEESFSFGDTRATWDPSRVADASEQDTSGDQDADGDAQGVKGADDALAIGTEAEVGEYTVVVTDVLLNANDAVESANTFNDSPDGQYVLVSLAVTYTGDEEGDPWLDLQVELAGSDSRIYDSSSCMAVTPNSAMDLPTLTNGGEGEFDVCFDVPEDALQDPIVFVEESMSFDDTRVAWLSQK